METSGRRSSLSSVGGNVEHIFCSSRTLVDVLNPLHHADIKGDLPAVRATRLLHNSATQVGQNVAPDVPEEEETGDVLVLCDDEYLPASQTSFATTKHYSKNLK